MTTTPLPIGLGVAVPCAKANLAPTDAARSPTTTRRTALLGSLPTIFMPSVVPALVKGFMKAAAIHNCSLDNSHRGQSGPGVLSLPVSKLLGPVHAHPAPSALAAWSQLRSVALEAADERGWLRIVPAGPRAVGGPQDGMHPLSIRDDSGR